MQQLNVTLHNGSRHASQQQSLLDTESFELVAEAIVPLPWQALPVLLLVGPIQCNPTLLALAIAPVAIAGFCRFPEGYGLDACHLPDQPIECLDLATTGSMHHIHPCIWFCMVVRDQPGHCSDMHIIKN